MLRPLIQTYIASPKKTFPSLMSFLSLFREGKRLRHLQFYILRQSQIVNLLKTTTRGLKSRYRSIKNFYERGCPALIVQSEAQKYGERQAILSIGENIKTVIASTSWATHVPCAFQNRVLYTINTQNKLKHRIIYASKLRTSSPFV